ncbi:hypothetical protein [Persicirhabdus sediminis]|uniref:Uncharacterized protein n=1 Tax=Persicirhabdus sediminis TaxID=454144 RepID=A0A8J7SI42_9BACT|nr:hypothetical protein [Persicirhabdus sediminis]MBK1790181.1 hypothetical protein [Persicirhabdus sediminis]
MKNLTLITSLGVLASLSIASADNYTNYILEIPVDENLPTQTHNRLDNIGDGFSKNTVEAGGTNFKLFTTHEGGSEWLLDTAFVDASAKSSLFIVQSQDPTVENGNTYRTRADKGYSLTSITSGLLPRTDDDPATADVDESSTYTTSSVVLRHEYSLSDDPNTLYLVEADLLLAPTLDELSSSYTSAELALMKSNGIQVPATDGTVSVTFETATQSTNIEATPKDQAYGIEEISILGVSAVQNDSAKSNNGHGNNVDGVDSSNPGKSKTGEDTDPLVDDEIKARVLLNQLTEEDLIINTAKVKIFPKPTGTISGITNGQKIGADFPSITLNYDNLYPGSDTYLVIYKQGEAVPTKEFGYNMKTVRTDQEPVSCSSVFDSLGQVIDSEGSWILEIRHDSPFEISELLDDSNSSSGTGGGTDGGTDGGNKKVIEVLPTVKVNADINTVK